MKTLRENFEVLPHSVQNIITDPLTRDRIISVGTKYNLTTDQKYSLENEMFFVLFGLEPLSRFRTNTVEKIGISYDQAIKISFDVNKEIFEPVMGLLKEMEEELRLASEPTPVNEHLKKNNPDVSQNDKSITTDHLLPSHEMIHEPHLHSQTVMPKDKPANESARQAASAMAVPKPPMPNRPESIVDQKLSGLVRTERGQAQLKNEVEEKRKNAYTAGDPYREPIK